MTFDPTRPPTNDPGWKLYKNNVLSFGLLWICQVTPENGATIGAITGCGTDTHGYQYVRETEEVGWASIQPGGFLVDPQPDWQTPDPDPATLTVLCKSCGAAWTADSENYPNACTCTCPPKNEDWTLMTDAVRTHSIAPNRKEQYLDEFPDGRLLLRSPDTSPYRGQFFVADPETLGKLLLDVAARRAARRITDPEPAAQDHEEARQEERLWINQEERDLALPSDITDPATLTVNEALARDDAENLVLANQTTGVMFPFKNWRKWDDETKPRKWKYAVTPEPALPGVESPYTPGARLMRADEAPEGWETRGHTDAKWRMLDYLPSCLIEARPPQPTTETIPVVDLRPGMTIGGKEVTAVHVTPWLDNRQGKIHDFADTIEVLK